MPTRLLPLVVLIAALVAPASASAIVGGQTSQRDWPHMAAMEFRQDAEDDWDLRCGASLVAPEVVLTAAHCVDEEEGPLGDRLDRNPQQFRFLVGSRKRSAGGERIGVVRILEHERYDDDAAGGHDLALLKLERSASLGSPIAIGGDADRPYWEPGDPSTIIGWGQTFYTVGDTPDDLQEAEVPIRSDEECQATSVFTIDPATMFCAGNDEGGEDTCQGDSGGPLMVRNATGRFVQVGVVSFGLGCAFPTQYGVYAEAGNDPLRTWILSNANALSTAGGTSTAAPVQGAPSPVQQPGGTSNQQLNPPRTARLYLPKRLGSARTAKRRKRLALPLRSSAAVRKVKARLRQGRKTVATGSLKRLNRKGTLRLRPRRGLRRGRAVLTVVAYDARGRRVSATRRVTVKR
jgi:trypsin